MGLLSKLALLPLTPVSGVIWLAEQIEQQARAEWDEIGSVRHELNELVAMHERGELSDDELAAAEDELIGRLDPATGEQADIS